eukprot:scaffold9288_cov62-Phaeocystis_antarctica.AAC.3
MPAAEGLALRLQRLVAQRFGLVVLALSLQEHGEVADGGQRARVPIAARLACHLQHLAVQRLSGGEVALGLQQHTEVVDGTERDRMTIAERLTRRLQHLAVQRLGLVKLALVMQLGSERTQAGDCGLPTRALGLEPCTHGRQRPPCRYCAATAQRKLCGTTCWSRGRRTAARAGLSPRPPSTPSTSPPPPPPPCAPRVQRCL